MNGFISVKSEPGKGSEFQFVVPQKVADSRPMAAVRDAESMNVVFYINTEKASFTEIRDSYLNSLCHMLEGLEVRYHQCRNLGELKRRTEREIYTHALISREEYLEDPAYFDTLSKQTKIIMIQDRATVSAPGERMTPLYKPFYVRTLAAVLDGSCAEDNGVSGPDGQSDVYMKAPEHLRMEQPEAPPSEKKAHIDREKGIRNMGGDPTDYEEVLQVYLEEGQEVLREIEERYQAEDWKNYAIYVHSLKSNSFGIGADGLGELAKALEAAAKEADTPYIQAHHAETMQVYGEVLAEIGGGMEDQNRSVEGRDRV